MQQPRLLSEKWLIMCHHPYKRRFLTDDISVNAGLLGAIIMDLLTEGAITAEGKKITGVGDLTTGIPEVHGEALRRMKKAKKVKSFRYWISVFNSTKISYKRRMVTHLIERGDFSGEQHRFLFFRYRLTQLNNQTAHQQLIHRLRSIVFGDTTPIQEDIHLLSLVQASNVHRLLASSFKEKRQAKRQIKALLANKDWANEVSMAITQELQAAVAASVAAVVAASSG
ncbi:MAG TPA: hypothetical protein DCE41_18360 [Cytophagales bacterium]|nr:hypothetical protein [Cytophagales bacterium]HAA19508.1 hypothetical protein [Cytophagales bacterium]HAP59618.1 hypothetical protein [Cytophagales bacterium]